MNECIQVSIHHSLDVAVFHIRAVVLHKRVGLEHIGADLAAPFDLFHFALDLRHLFHPLAFLELEEFTAQDAHGHLLVLQLAALVLALYHDAGGQMGNADG